MPSQNLASAKDLKREAPDQAEFDGLVNAAKLNGVTQELLARVEALGPVKPT